MGKISTKWMCAALSLLLSVSALPAPVRAASFPEDPQPEATEPMEPSGEPAASYGDLDAPAESEPQESGISAPPEETPLESGGPEPSQDATTGITEPPSEEPAAHPSEEPAADASEDPTEEVSEEPTEEATPSDALASSETPIGGAEESTDPSESPSATASQRPVTIQQTKEYVDENPWAQVLIRVILILLLTLFVAYVSKRLWKRAGERNRKKDQYLFRKYIYYFVQGCIYVVGVLCAVGQIPLLSQVVQTILAGSGIVALAVSLSAQESLNNIIGGIFITLFKPFEVGDRVALTESDVIGTIEDITLRHTIVKTFTNTRLVVPNAKMNQEMLENYNIVDARASSWVDVTVAYESDLDLAMQIMADVIGSHPLFLDTRPEDQRETTPKVHVYVRELGSSGVELRAAMWTRTVDDNYAACCDARLALKKAYDEAGIEIPYTKYTILHQGGKSGGDTSGKD